MPARMTGLLEGAQGHRTKVGEFVSSSWALGADPVQKVRALWHQTKNARVRIGLSRHHPHEVFSIDTRFGTLWFRDNFGDITNLGNLLHRAVYRWRELPDEGVILDVGANIGLAAVWFQHFNPTSSVWCFEPLSENVAMIRRNCPRASIVEAAMGEQSGSVVLNVDPHGVIASAIPTAWKSSNRRLPMRSLDDCDAEFVWGRIALLKIDAEGMEPEILRGARGLLPRVPRVAAETHGQSGHQQVLQILLDTGFVIQDASFVGKTGMVFAAREQVGARREVRRRTIRERDAT
ncbi:MAG: FkbM family methyltransferase [Gemmatimonadaceae bacterium]